VDRAPEPAREPKPGSFATRHPRATRILGITGIAFVAAIGVFGLGFASGWVVSDNYVAATTATADEPIDETVSALDYAVRMPDVRGLTPEEASQVLADAGLDITLVSTSERPAAGDPGLVIAQTPAFGAGDPEEVTLTISTTAPVPDVIGEPANTVIAELTDLGAQIVRELIYVPDATTGTVTAIDPAPGTALPSLVTIRVTSSATTVSLASIDSVGRCSTAETVTMDGKQWSDAVVCDSSATGQTDTWALDAAATEVAGTIGLDDTADRDLEATVEILGDGALLGTYQLHYGDSERFALLTSGVQELTLRSVSAVSESSSVVLGRFEARGDAAPIEALRDR
jgi:hypothetical protein